MAGKYTFHSFLECSENMLAKKACYLVTEDRESGYNTLFIQGDHQVGKTHLLYAIQSKCKSDNPECNVIFIDGQWFVKDVVNSIRYNSMKKLRNKYRNADVLLIDNIQSIIGKKSSQDELFHTIETLLSQNKQIVLTADRSLKDFKKMDERLESRLMMGLSMKLVPYSKNEKIEIVKSMALQNQIAIQEDIAEYMIDQYGYSLSLIRECLGQINRDAVNKKSIDEQMKILTGEIPKEISTDYIIQIVSEHFEIDREIILSKNRNNQVLLVRQIAMYLCMEISNETYSGIGGIFARNHATVINAVTKVRQLMKEDKSFKETIDKLSTQLQTQ